MIPWDLVLGYLKQAGLAGLSAAGLAFTGYIKNNEEFDWKKPLPLICIGFSVGVIAYAFNVDLVSAYALPAVGAISIAINNIFTGLYKRYGESIKKLLHIGA
jgi:hypothetical protein